MPNAETFVAPACGVCTKRHEIAAQDLAHGVRVPARLECRALPPRQDVSRDAIFPTVQPEFYCHVYFQVDAAAVTARDAAAAESARLDDLVAATAAQQPPLPLEPTPAQAAFDPADPDHAEPDDGKPKRARRARGGAAE